jgi:hypothetical protein
MGQQAVTVWQRIDHQGAAEFVNQSIDNHELTDANRIRVTMDLSFGNEESFARLRRYAKKHPDLPLAGNADLVLERTAPDWKAKAEEYGRRWRELRDCRTLLHLTNQLVDRRPREDSWISEILEIMGEPDSAVDGCYIYFTKPEFGGSLFLQTDRTGKVVGWKLDTC